MAKRTSSGKLEVTLPSDTEILMTRVFDAPRALVGTDRAQHRNGRGGRFGGHGGIEPEVMTVPLIAAGAGIRGGATPVDARLIDVVAHRYLAAKPLARLG